MSESVRHAAAAVIAKHRRLLRTGRDGRILSALMLPLVQAAAANGQGVLTTTGRITGRPRRKCVRAVRDNVYPIDYGECVLHLRGMPSQTKIPELQHYWFDTGTPIAIDL